MLDKLADDLQPYAAKVIILLIGFGATVIAIVVRRMARPHRPS